MDILSLDDNVMKNIHKTYALNAGGIWN